MRTSWVSWAVRWGFLAQLFWVLPFHASGDDLHLGVASCASSNCHGATMPSTTTQVRQDEYFTWQRKDLHAQAYRRLQTPRADAISSALGWGPAAAAPLCLDCHADAVPAALHGPRFRLDDGIGCEACHGGSERWIASHVGGFASLNAAESAGMAPTWDAVRRGELCDSCHVGDTQRPMTHAIMAAGHPPLLIELNTFSVLEPPHWNVDADYVQRKGPSDPAQDWAVGQATAARTILGNLAGPRFATGGVFPELAFFDCDACHHSMAAGRASRERNGGQPAGTVPLADAPLALLMRWLDVADPIAARDWRIQWTRLHASVGEGAPAVKAQAQAMLEVLNARIIPAVRNRSLDEGALRQLLASVVADAHRAHRGDFGDAEQTAMAVSVLETALEQRGAAPADPQLRASLDQVYAAVSDRDRFTPGNYVRALETLSLTLGPNATAAP